MIRPALLLLAALLLAAPAASAAPPPIRHLARKTVLSPSDREAIGTYVEYWSARLEADRPEDVDDARTELIQPLRGPVSVSSSFRDAYAGTALARLAPLLDVAGPHAAVGALQVIALLGTPQALETILGHADVRDEEDFVVRLWAANAAALAFQEGTLPENEVNRALRELGDAARREDEWLILRRQFEAIAVPRNAVSREVQADVLASVIQRIRQQKEASELMRAIYPAVKLVRDQFLVLGRREQERFGGSLAPVMCGVCAVADAHWNSAQENAGIRETYGDAVDMSETMLKLIDARMRPTASAPGTAMGESWRRRDERAFDADHGQWQAVLQAPPYNGH